MSLKDTQARMRINDTPILIPVDLIYIADPGDSW